MPNKKATAKNFGQVLDNIKAAYEQTDKKYKKEWIDWLNESLNQLLESDFFGTEGQLDPRGDQRD